MMLSTCACVCTAHMPEQRRCCAIAMQRGAKVSQVDSVDAALNALRAGQGSDLVMVDVTLDISRLVTSLRDERIHVQVVACGTEIGRAHV